MHAAMKSSRPRLLTAAVRQGSGPGRQTMVSIGHDWHSAPGMGRCHFSFSIGDCAAKQLVYVSILSTVSTCECYVNSCVLSTASICECTVNS